MLIRRVQFQSKWLFLIAVLLLPGSLGAAEETVYSAHTTASLVASTESIQPGHPVAIALRLQPDPQWHTYWKNPGDSGLPARLEWNLPEGFIAGDIQWPFPDLIQYPPLVSYGYHGEVFLFTEIQVPETVQPGTTASITAKAKWLACEKICIPGEAELSLVLPVTLNPPLPNTALAEKWSFFQNRLPVDSLGWTVEALHNAETLYLTLTPPEEFHSLTSVYFYPKDADLIDHAAKQSLRSADGHYILSIPLSSSAPKEIRTLQGVAVAQPGWRGRGSEQALAVSAPLKQTSIPLSAKTTATPSLLLILLFAFTGGIILNLMPCVLPVLSLKILNFIQHARTNRMRLFHHGLVFALGVLVSFWCLSLLLLILRAGGQSIGWGFQLQSPGFVIFLASLFFLFAFNLFGFFEIGASLTTAGNRIDAQSGLVNAFISGILATIVATPCTAPFMGSALGYGLTQTPVISMLIFTTLGLGMAFPYLLLSIFPELLRWIPRPGRWMIKLKKVLGILLLLTSGWLVWVLSLQKPGIAPLSTLLAAFVFFGAGARFYGLMQWAVDKTRKRRMRALAFTFLFFGILAAGLTVVVPSHASSAVFPGTGLKWQPYNEEVIAELRAEGKPIFIDFTAAWCLSCQVNERLALNVSKTKQLFEKHGITAFKADWTSRDKAVTRGLAHYGRNSVPLYVFFGREKNQSPILLPELITADLVAKIIDENIEA